MGTKENETALAKALGIAYNAVMNLGYTHRQIVDENHGINYNTLRRIREGKKGKTVTDRYFLQLFMSILDKEYKRRFALGGEGTATVLLEMRKITLTLLEIPFE